MEIKIVTFLFKTFVVGVIVFLFFGLMQETLLKTFIIGYGLPKENELQFETGYLKSYSETITLSSRGSNETRKYSRPVIVLTKNLNTATGDSYHCNYDYGVTKTSYCFNEDYIPKEYIRQFVKIEYYYQKDFLWLKDNRRKLVTLEVNGKTVISYQDTKDKIKSERNFVIFFMIFMGFVIFIAYIITLIEKNSSN